ncbi:MAG TPA: TylF/MycF/NovP-related O-methyltransferase [Candidatus Binatia bacterium]
MRREKNPNLRLHCREIPSERAAAKVRTSSALRLRRAETFLGRDRAEAAFKILNRLKALRRPIPGVDYLRAQCILRMGQHPALAQEALKEELRFFPANADARALLERLPDGAAARLRAGAEFDELYRAVKPYTMLSRARLFSLYKLAKRACAKNLPGNFVECGVAAGGASATLAAVIKKYSRIPRRLYAFDSFEGMPDPSAADRRRGVAANATGWGAGTCAAPQESLREICRRLGVENIVVPVKGQFEKTLPAYRGKVGAIALLHMDADWYASTRTILENFFEQVVHGGLIQVDDYEFWDGCRKAVTEFERHRGLALRFYQIDGIAVWCAKDRRRLVAESVENKRSPTA